jgi:HEAT repeat protein
VNTRRIIMIALGLFIVIGLGNFIVNSVQTRSQLALVASPDPAREDDGVARLKSRGILFDALQGGAPQETRLHAIAALVRLCGDGKHKEYFVELLQMLKDPDTESSELKTHPVRDAATDAVAKVGALYPDILMDAAKDQDGSIKAQSLAALRKIGKPMETQLASRLGDSALRQPFGDILSSFGPESIPLIAPYLKPPLLKTDAKPDDLAKTKIDLIDILGKFTAPEAATPILPFANDADPNVRRSVITSLANIGQPAGAPVLIAALTDPNTDPSARSAAAAALGAIASPVANAAMEKALSDYDLSVAEAAASGLKRAGDNADAAIAQALASPDGTVRAHGAYASGGLRSPAAASKALTDPLPAVRAAAADALGDIFFRATTSRTDMAALAAAPDLKAQEAALANLQKQGFFSELMTADAPPAARAHALDALTAEAAAEKDDGKRKPIDESKAKLTAAAAPVAGNPPVTPAALAPLVAALSDANGTVAQAAGRALSRIGTVAVAPLIAVLGSPNETVAYDASQALTTIGSAAVDSVVASAQASKPTARWAAITLGQLGDPRAIPALQALAQSPDPDTAYVATTALAKLHPS